MVTCAHRLLWQDKTIGLSDTDLEGSCGYIAERARHLHHPRYAVRDQGLDEIRRID